MQIIGAGFGRTGTMSLKSALQKLGFEPCYHMLEVLQHPKHIAFWMGVAEGQEINWDEILGKYQSGVDYPLAIYYKELMAAYPDAKVLLTVRDPQKWYESTIETIFKAAAIPRWLTLIVPALKNLNKMIDATVWDNIFDGRFKDKEYAIQVFEEHIAEVKRLVPAEKLLVYEVKEGWGPLCEFLGVPVPEKAFPHVNDRKTTKRMYLTAQAVTLALGVSVVGLLVWIVTLIV